MGLQDKQTFFCLPQLYIDVLGPTRHGAQRMTTFRLSNMMYSLTWPPEVSEKFIEAATLASLTLKTDNARMSPPISIIVKTPHTISKNIPLIAFQLKSSLLSSNVLQKLSIGRVYIHIHREVQLSRANGDHAWFFAVRAGQNQSYVIIIKRSLDDALPGGILPFLGTTRQRWPY